MNELFLWPSTRFLLVAAALCSLACCASISVKSGTEFSTQQMPKKVYVMTFSTAHSQFNVDREGAELKDFKTNLQKILQVAQVADLSHRLVPADAASRSLFSPRENAWLLRGEFVRVNQGSRLLRAAIGFGAGGTKVETKVYVYDLSTLDRRPFLTFFTTGGSNAEPGAVTAFATDPLTLAVQVVLSGASGISHGLTEDTERTAREITAQLSDYMYRSKWIPRDKWIEPKNVSPGDSLDSSAE